MNNLIFFNFNFFKNLYRYSKNIFGFSEYSKWLKLVKNNQVYPYISTLSYNEKKIYFNINDTRGFFIYKKYQDKKIKFLKRIISKLDFDFFLDFGANYGEFSLEMVDHVKCVISIEPNPIVSGCLKLSSESFNKIIVIEAALSEVDDKEIPLLLDPSYSGGASTSSYLKNQDYFVNHLSKVKPDYFSIFVRGISFNYLSEKYQFAGKKLFIKIDIEGSEDMVLKQIATFTEEFDEYIILFEFNQTTTPNIVDLINTFICFNSFKYLWSKNIFSNISNLKNPEDILNKSPEEIIISSVNLDFYCN